MNTLSDQQQHTSLLYIKNCSLLFSMFLFSSTEGMFSQQPKNEILNSKSLHYFSIFYSTVNSVKSKIKQTIHYCKHRKTQLCASGLMDPAVCWGLATGSHQHHKQCLLSLSIRENIPLCAEPIPGLTSPQCLRRPVPLPAEEAYRHVVGGHIRAISKRKKIPL